MSIWHHWALVLGVGLAICGIGLVNRWRRRRFRRRFAHARGFVKRGDWLVGHVQGRQVFIAKERIARSRRDVVSSRLVASLGLGLIVEARGNGLRLDLGAGGPTRLVTGDAAFDAAYVVEAQDPRALRLFGSYLRQQLVAASQWGIFIEIDDGRVRAFDRRVAWLPDEDWYDRATFYVATVANGLEQAVAMPPTSPHSIG